MRFHFSRVILFLILFLALINGAQAQQFGRDYLGGAKYCDLIIKTHPNGWAAGFFARTFGDALPCAEKLIQSGHVTVLRIELAWRDDHHFGTADFKASAVEAKRWEALQKKYPHVKILLSGACEHTLNGAQAQQLATMVKAAAPSCGYVNVPETVSGRIAGAVLKGQMNEVHGSNPQKPGGSYMVSLDGSSAFDTDMEKWKSTYKDAAVLFIWAPRDNGRQQGTTAPPTQRTAFPDENYMRSELRLGQPKGTAPKFALKSLSFTAAKSTLKTHAEDKAGNDDPRANHLMIIIPDHVNQVDVLDSKNQVIEEMPFYGSYTGGGYRYYSGRWGFLEGAKAQQMSGSEWVIFRAGSHVYGPANPAFRDGTFR